MAPFVNVRAGASSHTRSGFLGRMAAAGAGGARRGSCLAGGGVRQSRLQRHTILNFALALEYLQASFYTEAERIGALHGALAQQAHVVGMHERAHVKAFKELLGSAAIKEPTFNFHGVTENPEAFRSTAVAFEDLATAAYKEQAPLIKSRSYLAGALAIHSVEARHAAWIRRLAGFLPAAKAFDEPLSARGGRHRQLDSLRDAAGSANEHERLTSIHGVGMTRRDARRISVTAGRRWLRDSPSASWRRRCCPPALLPSRGARGPADVRRAARPTRAPRWPGPIGL